MQNFITEINNSFYLISNGIRVDNTLSWAANPLALFFKLNVLNLFLNIEYYQDNYMYKFLSGIL